MAGNHKGRPSPVHVAGDDVVLVFFVQLAEVAAPAPHAHDQVLVSLRVGLGVAQRVHVEAVDLQLLAAQYVAPTQPPETWLPFWVYRGKVTIKERKTQGGRSAERDAQTYWAQPRRVYIPAWSCDLIEARDLVEDLLEKQPVMEAIIPPEGAAFEPAVVFWGETRRFERT